MWSETKAAGALKPWWDIFYVYSLYALIAIDSLLFLSSHDSHSSSQVIIQDGYPEPEPEPAVGNVSAVPEALLLSDQDESVVNATTAAAAAALDKWLHTLPREVSNSGSYHEPNYAGPTATGDPVGVLFAIYTLVIFLVLWLGELSFDRMFYNHHFIHTLCLVLDSMTSDPFGQSARSSSSSSSHCTLQSSPPPRHNNDLVFSHALHHAHNRSSLKSLFDIHNYFRLVVAIVLFFLALYGQVVQARWKAAGPAAGAGVLLLLVLFLQSAVLTYASLWSRSLWSRRSSWGRLMDSYNRAIEKIDVVRGRCVPAPPYRKRQRVLDSLNPYAASPNIQLVLDLLAYRHGHGLALKCLAMLETDVASNWRPFRLSVKREAESLELTWKDPLAVLYLVPVPKNLHLHYGIEIYCPDLEDPVIEILGYDETRYYDQVWHAARPSVVEMKMQETFSYQEVFSDIPEMSTLHVNVWTIVDGQLIAKSSAILGLASASTAAGANCGCCSVAATGLPEIRVERDSGSSKRRSTMSTTTPATTTTGRQYLNVAAMSVKKVILTPADTPLSQSGSSEDEMASSEERQDDGDDDDDDLDDEKAEPRRAASERKRKRDNVAGQSGQDKANDSNNDSRAKSLSDLLQAQASEELKRRLKKSMSYDSSPSRMRNFKKLAMRNHHGYQNYAFDNFEEDTPSNKSLVDKDDRNDFLKVEEKTKMENKYEDEEYVVII